MTTPPVGGGQRVLLAVSIGSAWLAVARAILDDRVETRYDGLPVREISLVTLAVSGPDPASWAGTTAGDPVSP